MIIFRVRSERFFRIALLFVEVIAVTEFKEPQIRILTVGIVRNTLQSAKEQRLAHSVQIGAKRIHQHHKVLGRIGFQTVVICGTRQRVIQDFIETASHQLFGNQILQSVGLVPLTFRCQAGLQCSRNLYIIITVNTENIFYHVTIALHIHTIRRYIQCQAFCRFGYNLHFQTRHDALYCLCRNHLTYQ